MKEIFIQIVEGVSYLHSLGIVHRDIKLENILMSDNSDYSKPVLIDFGLSTLLPLNKKSDEPYGTIGYCSPEIIKNEFHNNKVDSWSLGCTLFAMFSQNLPFDDEDSECIAMRTVNGSLSFGLQVWKEISVGAKDMIA